MEKRKLWLFVSAASLLAASVAHAQTTASSPASTSAAADKAQRCQEVVVTAERRTVNLQTTAIAACVLTGADLAKKGVTSVDQLQPPLRGRTEAVWTEGGEGLLA